MTPNSPAIFPRKNASGPRFADAISRSLPRSARVCIQLHARQVKHVAGNAITRSSSGISERSRVYQKSSTVNDRSAFARRWHVTSRVFDSSLRGGASTIKTTSRVSTSRTCEPLPGELWTRAAVKGGSRVSVTTADWLANSQSSRWSRGRASESYRLRRREENVRCRAWSLEISDCVQVAEGKKGEGVTAAMQ